MAFSYNPVRSGDLITADLMNKILTELAFLDTAVTALQGQVSTSQMVVIISPTPATSLHIGDVMSIVGQNFGVPASVTITIDNQPIPASLFQPQSNSQLLVFTIPNIENLPPAGKQVTLTLSTATGGFTSTQFTLLPPAQNLPTGTITISPWSVPATPIALGVPYIFAFSVNVQYDVADTYNVTPTFNTTDTGWQAIVLDSTNHPNSSFSLGPAPSPNGITQIVQVQVTPPATSGTTASLVLKVASAGNPKVVNSSQGLPIKIGAKPTPVSQDILLGFSDIIPSTIGNATSINLTSANLAATVDFTCNFTVNKEEYYHVQGTFASNPGNLWSVTPVQKIIHLMGQASNVTISVMVAAQTGAQPATQLTLTVTAEDKNGVTDNTVTAANYVMDVNLTA